MSDVPKVGELVTVLTSTQMGEPGFVMAVDEKKQLVRLRSVFEGKRRSLFGAEGWYQLWEVERRESA